MNHALATLFDQFLKERAYLKNVTDRTLVWYRVAFKNHAAVTAHDAVGLPTKITLQHFVVRLRERGIKPVTCNTYVGAMNAFCGWLHEEGHATERVKLQKLRVERRLLTLLDDAKMRVLIGHKLVRCDDGIKRHLVKYAARVTDEIDADSIGHFGFDNRPVLLEHLHDFYPQVCAADGDRSVHPGSDGPAH